MPEERKELDLEERRRLLEERRRMLEKRRQELARRQKPAEGAKPKQEPSTRPPEETPRPSSAEAGPPEATKPKGAPPPTPKKPGPPPPPAEKVAPPPPKPTPPTKKPEEEPKKAREAVRPRVPPKVEVKKPSAPKKGFPMPLLLGAAAVIVLVVIIVIVSSGGKEQAEQRAAAEQARAESLQTIQTAAALEESLNTVKRDELNGLLSDLQNKMNEADALNAADRAQAEYEQARSSYEQAARLLEDGSFDEGMGVASEGLGYVGQALTKSQRIAEREEAARRSREEALGNLKSTVAALRESLDALATDGANDYARSQYQQLTQIIDKAGQFAGDGQLEDGQEQTDWAFEMTQTVREAIVDGKQQEAEALRLLEEMKETARRESLARAQEQSSQEATVMTPAKVAKWVSPVYPRMAQQAGIEGRVVVEFEVDANGKARDFVIIESLPAGCDDAAIEAIKRMEFTAATQGGKPVPTRIKMPFMFKKG